MLSEIWTTSIWCARRILPTETADQRLALQRQILEHCDRCGTASPFWTRRSDATLAEAEYALAASWCSTERRALFPVDPSAIAGVGTTRGQRRIVGAAVRTRRRRLCADGPSRGCSQGAGERARRGRRGPSRACRDERAERPQPRRRQLPARAPRTWHPDLGRADVERAGRVAIRQRPPPVHHASALAGDRVPGSGLRVKRLCALGSHPRPAEQLLLRRCSRAAP